MLVAEDGVGGRPAQVVRRLGRIDVADRFGGRRIVLGDLVGIGIGIEDVLEGVAMGIVLIALAP